MHQQPAQAPLLPKSWVKSLHLAGVSGCVSTCIVQPDCFGNATGNQIKKLGQGKMVSNFTRSETQSQNAFSKIPVDGFG